jgi:hypothetical protein
LASERPHNREGNTMIRLTKYPAPTVERPDMETLAEWALDSVVEATDGCEVEPDGTCEHGHPSWLIRFGII